MSDDIWIVGIELSGQLKPLPGTQDFGLHSSALPLAKLIILQSREKWNFVQSGPENNFKLKAVLGCILSFWVDLTNSCPLAQSLDHNCSQM